MAQRGVWILPTAADILNLEATVCASIGNWHDQSAVGAGSKQRKTRMPMATHYAHDRVRSSGEHKRWVVYALVQCMEQRSLSSTPRSSWTTLRTMKFDMENLISGAAAFALKENLSDLKDKTLRCSRCQPPPMPDT